MLEIIYCISLKEIKDRRQYMIKQLSKMKIKHRIVDGFYYKNDDVINEVNQIFDQKSKYNLREAQIAISMSHFKCIQEVLNSKYNICGIIEDDIKLVDNFEEKIKNYFKNSGEIKKKINTEPIIIFLTGLTSARPKYHYRFRNRENMFVNIGPQYGNCFYIINKLMAEIIIKNYLPINLPFDDFIISLQRKINFKNYYSAYPILCYDLSSELYKRFWTKDDMLTRKVFSRLSYSGKNRQGFENKLNLNLTNNIFSNLLKLVLEKYCNLKINNNKDFTNILFSDFINNSNKNSIIFGSGINKESNDNLLFREIFFVRGKLSKKYIENKKYSYKSSIEGDPFILIKEILNLKTSINIQKKYCFILENKPNINISEDTYFYLNSNNFNNLENINVILQSEYIFTDILLPIVISHSFNKKVYWINSQNIEIIDYYTSYNIPLNLINSMSITDLFKNNIFEEKKYLELDYNLILDKKKKISELIYFLVIENDFN
jgi:GR25 family glycosyltransferase involved in LPS biosynthesis